MRTPCEGAFGCGANAQRRRHEPAGRKAPGRGFAPLAVGLATLAIIAQLLAPASHRMVARGAAEIAGELKAAFGDVAVLCIQADDADSSRAPSDRSGHCDDCCPLCQFSAGAHALVLPTLLGAPTRIAAASETLAPAADFVRLKPVRTAFAQPRAPPLEV